MRHRLAYARLESKSGRNIPPCGIVVRLNLNEISFSEPSTLDTNALHVYFLILTALKRNKYFTRVKTGGGPCNPPKYTTAVKMILKFLERTRQPKLSGILGAADTDSVATTTEATATVARASSAMAIAGSVTAPTVSNNAVLFNKLGLCTSKNHSLGFRTKQFCRKCSLELPSTNFHQPPLLLF